MREAVDDYEAVFKAIYEGVDYFVVNVSCPNIIDLRKLQDQDSLEKILGRIHGTAGSERDKETGSTENITRSE